MVYRAIFTVVTGFALLSSSVCQGQADVPAEVALPGNGAIVDPTNLQSPARAATQPSNTADSTAVGHWWQRFAPPAGTTVPPANCTTTSGQSGLQSTTNTPAADRPLENPSNGSVNGREQTNPFAAKMASC